MPWPKFLPCLPLSANHNSVLSCKWQCSLVDRDNTIYGKRANNGWLIGNSWQECSHYQARCSWIVTDSCKASNWVVMNSRGTSNQWVTNVSASVLLTSLQWLFFCSESEYHIKQVILLRFPFEKIKVIFVFRSQTVRWVLIIAKGCVFERLINIYLADWLRHLCTLLLNNENCSSMIFVVC